MDTIRIPLGRSGVAEAWATIDFEDYERVALYRWYLNADGYAFIAYAKDRKTTGMHRYVLGLENNDNGMHVDHIDRNPLNNTKANLRVVTPSVNMLNTSSSDRARERIESVGEIARRFRSMGVSVRAIAEGLGISMAAVAAHCADIQDYPGRRRTQPWTREEIIERFQDFERKHGRLPERRDLGKYGLPWRDNFLRHFASLDEAHTLAHS